MTFHFEDWDPDELHAFIHAMNPVKLRDYLAWVERWARLGAAWDLAKRGKPRRLDDRLTALQKQIMEAAWWCEMYVDLKKLDKKRRFKRDLVLMVRNEVLNDHGGWTKRTPGQRWSVQDALTHLASIRHLTFAKLKATRGKELKARKMKDLEDLGPDYVVCADREFRELVNLGHLVSKRGRGGGYRVAEFVERNSVDLDSPAE